VSIPGIRGQPLETLRARTRDLPEQRARKLPETRLDATSRSRSSQGGKPGVFVPGLGVPVTVRQ
jgi:hypothetical protein